MKPVDELARRASALLFSSRPSWAMMPGYVATNFAENLLFLLSALEHHGLVYTAHFGTLLGAVRLSGICPWDEDADIYLVDEDRASVEEKLRAVLEQHGFQLLYDQRDFFWVKQHPWVAGQGHIGLSFLPRVKAAGAPAPNHPSDPAMAHEELYPLRRYAYYATSIWGPANPEAICVRLYGETGSVATMARFAPPSIDEESRAFWSAARDAEGKLRWPEISARFMARRRRHPWQHFRTFPWWWANGAYNIGIGKLRRWGEAKLGSIR